MANTFTLKFPTLRVVNTVGAMSDVVKEIHWHLIATSDGSPQISEAAYGSNTIPDPAVETFISYDLVTVTDVKDWFSALEDEDGNNILQTLKDGLDAQIARKLAPLGYVDNTDQTFNDGLII